MKWPTDARSFGDMAVPVVSMEVGAGNMELLARGVDEFLHRALVEEEAEGTKAGERAPTAGACGVALEQGLGCIPAESWGAWRGKCWPGWSCE